MDRYSKCVLTVIAVALVTIAIQNTISPAVAFTEGCGQAGNPCRITTDTRTDPFGLPVYFDRR